MQALILSAGHGTRMGALTDVTPKPLLEAGGQKLVEYQIKRLAKAGIRDIVINISHLAEQFEPALGDGSKYGVSIAWSHERGEPLETAGGIREALHLFSEDEFIVTNGDVYIDIDYAALKVGADDLANLVLVPNPDFHPNGDFWFFDHRTSDGWRTDAERFTFAGVGAYRAGMFKDLARGRAALAPLLRQAMDNDRCGGIVHRKKWVSVDTPERLADLDREIRSKRGRR